MSLPHQSVGRFQGQPRARPGRGRWTHRPAEPRPGVDLYSNYVRTCGCAATRCNGVTVGPLTPVSRRNRRCKTVSAGSVETGNGVTNEEADSVGSAVLVSACGALVSALRHHAEIVRAHADRESPKPPARSFPVRSHSLGRCRHGGLPSFWEMVQANRSQGVNGVAGRRAGIGGGVARRPCMADRSARSEASRRLVRRGDRGLLHRPRRQRSGTRIRLL